MLSIVLALAAATGLASTPAAVHEAAPRVVAVRSVDGAGSGFPIGEDLVVTAMHVTEDRAGVQLWLQDGSIIGGEVIASSPPDDLALIRVNEPVFEPIALASDAPGASTSVWVLADPPDDETGVLIEEGSTQASPRTGGYLSFLAEVREGFSGGPVVDAEGEVVGVMDATTSDGTALAVPVDAVRRLVSEGQEAADTHPWTPWREGAVIGALLLTAGLCLRRRAVAKGSVRIRLGAVRDTAPTSPRLEEP